MLGHRRYDPAELEAYREPRQTVAATRPSRNHSVTWRLTFHTRDTQPSRTAATDAQRMHVE